MTTNLSKNIKVQVVCLAYNQVEFIRDALNGFVMQKTNFPFEVLVGDDCSTDGTSEIIAEYPLYSKYDKEEVNRVHFAGWNIVDNKPTTKEEAQGSFIQEKLVDYSIDKTWFHSICGAEWRDVKGKNQIIYKMLDDILFDRY